MKNLVNQFYDIGKIVLIIFGAFLMISDAIEKGLSWGLLNSDSSFIVGLGLVLISFAWMALTANKKAREEKEKYEKLKSETEKTSTPIPVVEKQANIQLENQYGKYNFGSVESLTISEDNNIELENERERLSKPRVDFGHLSYQCELKILGATVEQVMKYIRNDIAADYWHTPLVPNDDFMYGVNPDLDKTLFYYPEKDNVDILGIKFYVDKHRTSKNEKGGTTTKFDSSIRDMFQISIHQSGVWENIRLLVFFDTQYREACGFFDYMITRLEKAFTLDVVKRDKKYWGVPL